MKVYVICEHEDVFAGQLGVPTSVHKTRKQAEAEATKIRTMRGTYTDVEVLEYDMKMPKKRGAKLKQSIAAR